MTALSSREISSQNLSISIKNDQILCRESFLPRLLSGLNISKISPYNTSLLCNSKFSTHKRIVRYREILLNQCESFKKILKLCNLPKSDKFCNVLGIDPISLLRSKDNVLKCGNSPILESREAFQSLSLKTSSPNVLIVSEQNSN